MRFVFCICLCLLVSVSGVLGEEVDYGRKLAELLRADEDGKSSDLIQKLMEHAMSNDRHVTLPDIVDSKTGGGGEGGKGQVVTQVSERADRLKKSITSAVERRGVTENRKKRLDSQSKHIHDLTKKAIDILASHGAKTGDMPELFDDLDSSLDLANKILKELDQKLGSFNKLIEELYSASREMHTIYGDLVEDLNEAKHWGKDVAGTSFRRIIWYYIILLQLFAFVAYAFYRRNRTGYKYGRLS